MGMDNGLLSALCCRKDKGKEWQFALGKRSKKKIENHRRIKSKWNGKLPADGKMDIHRGIRKRKKKDSIWENRVIQKTAPLLSRQF
jgi:hypothetical protein